MELLAHILDRFVIHFFASTSLVLATFFFLRYAYRRWSTLFQRLGPELLTAALIVFALSTLREAYDVHNGQPLIKAFTDYLSWFLGCALSVFAVYRVRKL